MNPTDRLYNFLPRYNQRSDIAEGLPLQALFDILQVPHDAVREDIWSLHNDWFVESCEPWLLPYIADLIGGTDIDVAEHPSFDGRRLLANTVGYRRRKGLQATLENVIFDVTGWHALVVENTFHTAKTQSVRFTETSNNRVFSLRHSSVLSDSLSPPTRYVSMRPDVGLSASEIRVFIWRVNAMPLRGIEVFTEPKSKERRMVHPLGFPTPLYQRWFRPPVPDIRSSRDIVTLPLRQATKPHMSLALQFEGEATPLGPDDILVRPLAHSKPADYSASSARVIVDPDDGSLLLLNPKDKKKTLIAYYSVGMRGDIGGGSYARPEPFWPSHPLEFYSAIFLKNANNGLSLGSAISKAALEGGTVWISDSRTHNPDSDTDGWSVELTGEALDVIAIRAEQGERPCLTGRITVTANQSGGVLVLDGLLIGGPIHIEGPVTLVLNHCTLAPHKRNEPVLVVAENAQPKIVIAGSITGHIAFACAKGSLDLSNSIVDGAGRWAISTDQVAGGIGLSVENCTVNGAVSVGTIDAINSIFVGKVTAHAVRHGKFRHCYVPHGSVTPQQENCVSQTDHSLLDGKALNGVTIRRDGEPAFIDHRIGHPDYFQISNACPAGIVNGASDGGEMGAFHSVGNHARLNNLKSALEQYLPLGLEHTIKFAP